MLGSSKDLWKQCKLLKLTSFPRNSKGGDILGNPAVKQELIHLKLCLGEGTYCLTDYLFLVSSKTPKLDKELTCKFMRVMNLKPQENPCVVWSTAHLPDPVFIVVPIKPTTLIKWAWFKRTVMTLFTTSEEKAKEAFLCNLSCWGFHCIVMGLCSLDPPQLKGGEMCVSIQDRQWLGSLEPWVGALAGP